MLRLVYVCIACLLLAGGIACSDAQGIPQSQNVTSGQTVEFASSTINLESTGTITWSTKPIATPSIKPPPVVSSSVSSIIFVIICLLIILVVVVVVVGRCILGGKKRTDWERAIRTGTNTDSSKCFCHVFWQEGAGTNCWTINFSFSLKDNLDAAKLTYKKLQFVEERVCLPVDINTLPAELEIIINDGWYSVHGEKNLFISRAAIQRSIGQGEPLYHELTVKPISDVVTPPDLLISVNFGVKEPGIQMFKIEARNIVKCVCQVFYHKEVLNCWRATFAFFPKEHFERVNKLYQGAHNFYPVDVNFSGGVIKVTPCCTTAGWDVIVDEEYNQVSTADVERYNGVGNPPVCILTLKPIFDESASVTPNLTLPVILDGVKQPSTITLNRRAETSEGGICPTSEELIKSPVGTKCIGQVFYHKEGLNCWKVTFAFFPTDKLDRVKEFYQDANVGSTFDLLGEYRLPIKPNICDDESEGWRMTPSENQLEIMMDDVELYTGEDKPPCWEMTLSALSETPPDFKLTADIFGVGNKVHITRTAEGSTSLARQHQLNPESFRLMSKTRFDARGLKHHLSDHGITVIVPENAVHGDGILSIGVYYVNSFQFPPQHRLVSAVFWIDCSVCLLKQVELYIPYFVKIARRSDMKKLGFFLASDKFYMHSGVLQFNRAPSHSYSFDPESSYGKLVMDHFCSGCILEKQSGDDLPLQYLLTCVLPNDCDKPSWTADFVFSYGIPTCHKVIENQYSPKDDYSLYSQMVNFTQSKASLSYNLEPTTGWLVKRNDMLQQISQESIDYQKILEKESKKYSGDASEFWKITAPKMLKRLEDLKQYPPRLSLKITRTQRAQEHLRTVVTVNGVEPQTESTQLSIELVAPCSGIYELGIHSPMITSQKRCHSPSPRMSIIEGDRFSVRDATLVLEDELGTEWFKLGLCLGVDIGDLHRYQHSTSTLNDCRNGTRDMLTAWKQKFGREANWDKIVTALREIKFNELAQKVEEQFIHPFNKSSK